MTRQTSPTYRSTAKLVVCKETFLPNCYQMRIGYITIYYMTVRSDNPVSSDTFLFDSSIDHRKMIKSQCDSGIFESSKKDPALIDLRFVYFTTHKTAPLGATKS